MKRLVLIGFVPCLVFSGCGGGPGGSTKSSSADQPGGPAVEVDAGKLVATKGAKDAKASPGGETKALQRLAAEVEKNPNAATIIVHWDSPSSGGKMTQHTIEYGRSTDELFAPGAKGEIRRWREVTDENVQAVAREGGTLENLVKHGAKRQ